MSWRSLHVRMALVLLLALGLAGVAQMTSSLLTTRFYLREVLQSRHLGLARNIAALKHGELLDRAGELREQGVEELLHWMMVVHPGPHFYILDLRGRVLAYDPSAGEPLTHTVSLQPVRRFLDQGLHEAPEDGAHRTILGEDPRHPGRSVVFSVSPLPPTGETAGYLYIVLETDGQLSVPDSVRRSHVLRYGVVMALAALVLAVLVGGLVFSRLTRPLRRLATRMGRIGGGEAGEPVRPAGTGDEVSLLEQRFEAMEARIQEQLAEIEHASDLRRELMANISHDLRTPLTTLRGYLETLALGERSLPAPRREEYLSITLAQAERLGRLIDELFELTKLDRNEIRPKLERFRIGELVQDNIQRFQLRAEEREIDLRAELDPGLPPVYVDIGLMERALENLIENALRYTDAGGEVAVVLREEAHRLEVCVRDTGRGIAAEDLPHVFDRFFRSGAARRSAKDAGAGLGLAITRRIVELHGSTLEVESELGEGSTFSFGLEIAPLTHQLPSEVVDRLGEAMHG